MAELHDLRIEVTTKVKRLKSELQSSGFMAAFFGFFGGRCTTFAIAFFIVGVFLALRGKLDPNFVALAGIIQSLIVLHSGKEDYHERAMAAITAQNPAPDVPPAS